MASSSRQAGSNRPGGAALRCILVAVAIDVVDGISVAFSYSAEPARDSSCIDVTDRPLLDDRRISLSARAVRECDKAARKLLGSPRSSSVFSAPARPALKGRSFEEALRLNRESSAHAVGISQQCFGIIPKIREVDDYITPELQGRVVEVHPELVFYEMSGGKSVKEGKKSKGGLAHRLELLAEAFDFNASELVENHRSSKVARDDIVDAMAACWTAERILKGEEVRVPNEPVRDSKGLLMEIVR